jgi:hypothetical protein
LNTLRKLKAENEKKEAAEWSVGAKDNSKAKMSEDKEAEKLRKAAEKLALNAEDEACYFSKDAKNESDERCRGKSNS